MTHEPANRGTIALLREDPDLGEGIADDERPHAERLIVVPGLMVAAGPLDLGAVRPDPGLGVLLLDGLITSNVVIGDRVAASLAGPGDVIYDGDAFDSLLPVRMAYFASSPARLALLDRTFLAAIRRWPSLMLTLHARVEAQERRLAIHAALGKLRRVEDRVLALLWHMAERWGRIAGDQVVLPLSLTHETLGRLAGAQRSTVTLALGELAAEGALHRRDDGAFVLVRDALERLRPEGSDAPQLRPLEVERALPRDLTPTPERAPAAVDVRTLRRRLATLREELPERTRQVDEILATSRAGAKRSAETRQRIRDERVGRD